MQKTKLTEILSITISLVTLVTIISAGFFWFYKTNSLPARVDIAEQRLDKIEKQMIENSTKTDLIYSSVLEIRAVLLRK